MLIWKRELDIYGKVRFLKGEEDFIPFRYQGQYYDKETKLCYNRFRYNSPETGLYISQDPIGLLGGMALYGYVHDSNGWARATSSHQQGLKELKKNNKH